MPKKKKNGNGYKPKKVVMKRKNCPSCLGTGKIPLNVYGGNERWVGVAWELCDLCRD